MLETEGGLYISTLRWSSITGVERKKKTHN